MKKKFIRCKHTYYYNENYSSLSDEGFQETMTDCLININQTEQIWKTEYEHLLFGKVQSISYLIIFSKPKRATHLPVIIFKTQKERDNYFNKISKQVGLN